VSPRAQLVYETVVSGYS